MPELTSRHPNNKQEFTFNSTATQPEMIGNRSGKQREQGFFQLDDYSEAVELFTRTVDAREYADVWNLFIQHGLPVVPDLWQDETGKIYMPNLTENGSGLYGKAFEQAYSELQPKQVDRLFINLWNTQKSRIEQASQQLADYASERELLLPLDDPFDLQVNPDGSWGLIILDLEYGGTLDDLLQRKQRFTNQRIQYESRGKTIDQLNFDEKAELVYLINRRSAGTALNTLQLAVNKLSQQ